MPHSRSTPGAAPGAAARDGIVAAVRGAISVRANRAADIREATARLLAALIERNAVTPERVVSAVFTATPDLTADFPAHAARRLGWTDVPLLGAVELGVPGAPGRIVRVLLTLRDVPRGTKLVPAYLDDAAALRPDLSDTPEPALRAQRGRERRIALIGLGQIGGSIGLALEDTGGWHRIGFDTRAGVRREALARGVVDEAARSLAEACRDVQLAVVSVPVDVLPRVIAEVAGALPAGAALLDTGSARGGGVTAALARAAVRVRAVGGHPIAGNEQRGLAGARAQLFLAAPFALLPARGAAPRRRARPHEPPAVARLARARPARKPRRARSPRGPRLREHDPSRVERPPRRGRLREGERRERACGMASAACATRS